jgi:two-component system response regulator NreC
MALSILLADDHPLFLQGMKSLLEAEGYEVVGEAIDGRQAVQLTEALKPRIAIVDISMPGLNGLDAAQKIRKVSPKTKVIVLTMHQERPYVVEALRSEVDGYVLKTQAAQDVIAAIRAAVANKVYLSPGISDLTAVRPGEEDIEQDPLTLREREVLQLIAEGHRTKQIAMLLGVSVTTAESHRTRIMSKLDIHDTASLVRYAIRNRLTNP